MQTPIQMPLRQGPSIDWTDIVRMAQSQGLNAVGVSDVDLSHAKPHLARWLAEGMHGQMDYMSRHGSLRAEPDTLVPGTIRIITVRLNYLPSGLTDDWREQAWEQIDSHQQPYVSLYARGRDYHKVMRKKLQRLSDDIQSLAGPMGYRVFCDSAPVMEVELARKAGIGWRGKHTLLIHRDAGSMFFLGEILTDLPLEPTPATTEHCGQCTQCIDICPTRAIVKPYWLDARRCISYLTIEHAGPIPVEFRRAIGTRIYGCDDCQLICPWNKFAHTSALPDFDSRPVWQQPDFVTMFEWTEDEFLKHTEGSAIRRIGHERWQRNLAVAMGNALADESVPPGNREAIRHSLQQAINHRSELVREHVMWALLATTQT